MVLEDGGGQGLRSRSRDGGSGLKSVERGRRPSQVSGVVGGGGGVWGYVGGGGVNKVPMLNMFSFFGYRTVICDIRDRL